MSAALDPRAAIDVAVGRDEHWTLILEHDDGERELVADDEVAFVLAAPEQDLGMLGEALVVPDPVACDVVAGAGVYPLNGCDRCDALLAE